MFTTKYIRDNLEQIQESMKRRKIDYPVDRLLELDKSWRVEKEEKEVLQAKLNKASLEISDLKKQGKDIKANVAALPKLKEKIAELDKKVSKNEQEIEKLLWNMPNILDKVVPYGESEEQNVTIRTWGTVDKKKKSANHIDTYKRMGLVDIEQAAKVSGARFYYLKGDLALLEQALIRFGIDEMVKKGYTLIAPPLMLKK